MDRRQEPWLFQNFCGEYVEEAASGLLHDMVRMSFGRECQMAEWGWEVSTEIIGATKIQIISLMMLLGMEN